MNVPELAEDIRAQLHLMRQTQEEISLARQTRTVGEMRVFDLAGFGALLMNFYSGVENILKRVLLFEGVSLPAGPDWHTELFNRACRPLPSGALCLLSAAEADLLRDYRTFRHVMAHGYGVRLKWELMAHLVDSVEPALAAVTRAVERYLDLVQTR